VFIVLKLSTISVHEGNGTTGRILYGSGQCGCGSPFLQNQISNFCPSFADHSTVEGPKSAVRNPTRMDQCISDMADHFSGGFLLLPITQSCALMHATHCD